MNRSHHKGIVYFWGVVTTIMVLLTILLAFDHIDTGDTSPNAYFRWYGIIGTITSVTGLVAFATLDKMHPPLH